MTGWIVLTSLTDFNTLNAHINTSLGFPTSNGQTVTYAAAIKHPTNGQYAMYIQTRAYPFLSSTQQTSLQTDAQMLAAGWVL